MSFSRQMGEVPVLCYANVWMSSVVCCGVQHWPGPRRRLGGHPQAPGHLPRPLVSHGLYRLSNRTEAPHSTRQTGLCPCISHRFSQVFKQVMNCGLLTCIPLLCVRCSREGNNILVMCDCESPPFKGPRPLPSVSISTSVVALTLSMRHVMLCPLPGYRPDGTPIEVRPDQFPPQNKLPPPPSSSAPNLPRPIDSPVHVLICVPHPQGNTRVTAAKYMDAAKDEVAFTTNPQLHS
jgi:hypothetical protein